MTTITIYILPRYNYIAGCLCHSLAVVIRETYKASVNLGISLDQQETLHSTGKSHSLLHGEVHDP